MLYKLPSFTLSEGCCDEQYPSRLEGKGKILLELKLFKEARLVQFIWQAECPVQSRFEEQCHRRTDGIKRIEIFPI